MGGCLSWLSRVCLSLGVSFATFHALCRAQAVKKGSQGLKEMTASQAFCKSSNDWLGAVSTLCSGSPSVELVYEANMDEECGGDCGGDGLLLMMVASY